MRKRKCSSGDDRMIHPYQKSAIQAGQSREGWMTSRIKRVYDRSKNLVDVQVTLLPSPI